MRPSLQLLFIQRSPYSFGEASYAVFVSFGEGLSESLSPAPESRQFN
ncbi:hypothetical protein H6G96_31305 [Nostoc sp. FACHB-892]|nr:hypothetical protein [Nostoc sp. FACHB-892]MBD2730688.1 hypothetical protein [Nostoc sp. FACHB-892]